MDIEKLLRNGFITSNSTPDGKYTVEIQLSSLADAHLLHREMLAIRNGNYKVIDAVKENK